jgi:2'-5' RNA ligase
MTADADASPRSGGPDWRRPSGIFIIAEVSGDVGRRIHEIQREFDPKLAAQMAPHVTLIGSSGAGPIAAATTIDELRAALEPITRTTPPLTLHFSAPVNFMQTPIVVLPLDPHGPLRVFHDRICTSGLRFGRARFTFTPHVTLSFYRTLTSDERRRLLSLRITDPVRLDRIDCSLTRDPQPPVRLLSLPFEGVVS